MCTSITADAPKEPGSPPAQFLHPIWYLLATSACLYLPCYPAAEPSNLLVLATNPRTRNYFLLPAAVSRTLVASESAPRTGSPSVTTYWRSQRTTHFQLLPAVSSISGTTTRNLSRVCLLPVSVQNHVCNWFHYWNQPPNMHPVQIGHWVALPTNPKTPHPEP